MNRATRKANLKKLQLPVTSDSSSKKKSSDNLRKTRSSKTTTVNTLTDFFLSPNKLEAVPSKPPINCDTTALDEATFTIIENDIKATSPPHPSTSPMAVSEQKNCTRATKRTKLTAFVFKDSKNIPAHIVERRKNDADVFETPHKKIKKAPVLKTTRENSKKSTTATRKKRQPNIKSAFLRNEEAFSQITAQHCIAENFNPDDMQLALAISKSEAETNAMQCLQTADEVIVDLECAENRVDESIRTKLQKYGFRTANKDDYNTITAAFLPGAANRRTKSKWANKFTALTLRNPEVQLKKVHNKIENFLCQQYRTKSFTDAENHMAEYQLLSSRLKKCEVEKVQIKNSENFNTNDIEKFFIQNLFEVTHIKAGHLLKDWSAIQGRDLSPKKSNNNSKSKAREKAFQNVYIELMRYFSACQNEDKESNAEEKHKEIVADNETKNNAAVNVYLTSAADNSSPTTESIEHLEHNSELDKMVDLLENESSNNNIDMEVQEILLETTIDTKSSEEQSSLKTSNSMSSSLSVITITSAKETRLTATSPDIFADDDSDVELNEETNDDPNHCSTSSLHDITTFELYSSDEVKNSSNLVDEQQTNATDKGSLDHSDSGDIIIDLTQREEQQPRELLDFNATNDEDSIISPHKVTDAFNHSDSVGNIINLTQREEQQPAEFFDFNSSNYCTTPPHKATEPHSKSIERMTLNLTDNTILKQNNDVSDFCINLDYIHEITANFVQETHLKKSPLKVIDTKWKNLVDKYLNCDKFEVSKRKSLSLTQLDETNCTTSRKGRSSLTQINRSYTKKTCHTSDVSNNFTLDFEGWQKTPTKQILSHSTSFTLNITDNFSSAKSPAKSDTNLSIDLTQNDENDDEAEEDYLILSDDEINYSIWKADKAEHCKVDKRVTKETYDLTLSSDSEHAPDDDGDDDTANAAKETLNFSYMDLIDEQKSFQLKMTPRKQVVEHDMCTLNLDDGNDFEPISSQFLATPLKLDKCISQQSNNSTADVLDLYKERAEFGILESYSEPFTQSSQYDTPQKNSYVDISIENSFTLKSPSENSAFMKRYSCSNSEKFNVLLEEAKNTVASIEDDELDEFDKLVYGSPLGKSKSSSNSFSANNEFKTPSGFDKLLCAEINFHEFSECSTKEQKIYRTHEKHSKTPIKTDAKKCQTTKESFEVHGRVYNARLTHSPTPNFSTQSEAELLKQLYNYGVKPLKRKQAVKILDYIYKQTHPTIILEQEMLAQTSRQKITTATNLNSCAMFNRAAEKETQNLAQDTTTNKVNSQELLKKWQNKLNLQDCYGDVFLRFSDELQPELIDEDYIYQTNKSKKLTQPLLPLHIAWFNLVCSNAALHESILMYEPIDLQEIYLYFKHLGYRYDPKDLKIFFDRRCIIFRYDLTPAGNDKNRHVRNNRKKPLTKP